MRRINQFQIAFCVQFLYKSEQIIRKIFVFRMCTTNHTIVFWRLDCLFNCEKIILFISRNLFIIYYCNFIYCGSAINILLLVPFFNGYFYHDLHYHLSLLVYINKIIDIKVAIYIPINTMPCITGRLFELTLKYYNLIEVGFF